MNFYLLYAKADEGYAVGVLFLICLTVFLVQRHRASRARDAIATVEASQVEGPLPTPFGSSFVQVPQGQPVSYPAMAYGPRPADGSSAPICVVGWIYTGPPAAGAGAILVEPLPADG